MSKRKRKMDHAAHELWKITLHLFSVMGYRPDINFNVGRWIYSTDSDIIHLCHRDRKHPIRPDVETLERYFTVQFRVVPFNYKIDSRSGTLTLERGYLRQARSEPGKRSIIV